MNTRSPEALPTGSVGDDTTAAVLVVPAAETADPATTVAATGYAVLLSTSLMPGPVAEIGWLEMFCPM